MSQNKIHILSTRPLDPALVEEAAKQDIVVDEISFISTETIVNSAITERIKHLLKGRLNIVFTSMNAVEAVRTYLQGSVNLNIYCIGNTTKNLIEKYFGAKNIAGTADNASDLAGKIIENTDVRNVVFFCGDQRRNELPEKLKTNDISVEEIVVYKTIETSQVVPQLYDAILFYSPSPVNSFFQKNTVSSTTNLFAIGATTADALKHFTKQPVIIAEVPGKENLARLAFNHFNKSKIT